jgi:hypothetical protein
MKFNLISLALMAATASAWTVKTPSGDLEGEGTIPCTPKDITGSGEVINFSNECYFLAYSDAACLDEIVAFAPEGAPPTPLIKDAKSYVVIC